MFKYVIVLSVILAALGGSYYYVKSNNDKMEALIKINATYELNQKTLQGAINKSNETIDTLTQEYANIKKQYEGLEADYSLMRMYGEELPAKFERHDLNDLALAKPELVEKIINSASKDANRCMEILSGASILEGEKNSECPWLFE